jgi:hypothetical protein
MLLKTMNGLTTNQQRINLHFPRSFQSTIKPMRRANEKVQSNAITKVNGTS